MSYHPHQDHNPYPSHNPGRYPQQDGYYGEPPRDRRYDDGADTVANIVRAVVGVVIAIFALHVLFVVFGANQGNEFASFVYTAAQVFVLGLGDVFTPDDALLGVVLNYGLAALVYAIVGQLVVKALQRR